MRYYFCLFRYWSFLSAMLHTVLKFYLYVFHVYQLTCSVVSDSLWPHGLQHTRFPCPSPNSWSLLKLMSIKSVMPSNHLILCHPLILLPSIFPWIRFFSNESVLCIRWPKYWRVSLEKGMADHFSILALRTPWTEWKKLFYFFINGMGSPVRWQASHSWECLSRVAEEGSGKGGRGNWVGWL